jgi:zinc protease
MSGVTLSRGLTPARAVLDNGIVVLAQESGATPAMAINATFLAGSAEDPDHLPGVAYLARRTIDRGTATLSAEDIADILDDRGVSLRVSVSRHTFSISCVCLAEDFDDILSLIADVARAPQFPEEEIEKRRLEAITSLREDHDDPAKVAVDLLHEDLYGPNHPYGRPTKGTLKSLETITRRDLLEYYGRYLSPSRLRIAIAGDISGPEVLAAVGRQFGRWVHRDGEPIGIPQPPDRRQRSLRRHPIPAKAQADLAYGFTTIRRLDPRYYAYGILNNVLGQFGLGGRLADNIRERQGMAYYAYSTLEASVGEGPLIIRVGVDPNDVDRALAAIDAEVRALCEEGPTEQELEDTRESLVGSVPRMLETNESISEFLIYVEQFGLGLDYDRRVSELFRQVTMRDVRDVAREALDPARAAVVVAGPVQ